MSDTQLVVLSLASEESARDLVRQLDAIDKLDANVTIVDAAIAIKNRRGKPKLKQLKVAGSGKSGVLGAIGGAFSGLTSMFRDAGIDDDMMRRTAEDMAAGEVALFILYTGQWDRSSAVLQDALAAHGIHYTDSSRPESFAAAAGSASTASAADATGDSAQPTALAADNEESVFDDEPEFEAEPDVDVGPDPVFGDESVEELRDPVAEAARSAMIAAAAEDTRAADAAAYAEGVAAVSEATGIAGAIDTRQGVEMLDASAQVSDAGARIGLLSLERKYGGIEIGRIAGELAEIGREVGEQEMPILSALLANRSGILQRIAADTIATAATARELANVLDDTGVHVGDLGSAEVDEGATRLAIASALAAQAADAGAAGFAHADQATVGLSGTAADFDSEE